MPRFTYVFPLIACSMWHIIIITIIYNAYKDKTYAAYTQHDNIEFTAYLK